MSVHPAHPSGRTDTGRTLPGTPPVDPGTGAPSRTPRASLLRRSLGAAAALVVVAACGAGGDANDAAPAAQDEAADAQVAGQADGGADEDAEGGEVADGGGDAGSAGGGSAGGYLDELYADALHDGITPAAPGTAYIEVAGERIDFTEVTCLVDETPGAQRFRAEGTADADGVGHMMYIDREIGPDIGWSWEDELVQLALLTTVGSDDAPAQYSNSMVQHEREEGGDPEWDHGDGASPVIRVVGTQATATGTLDGILFADSPLEGEFVAAATCP